MNRDDRIRGVLFGTAIGDALGLPAEGLSAEAISRRFRRLAERYRLFGRTGFVSDDTEQTALVAHAWLDARGDNARLAPAFARRLRAWFLALPLGIGLATVKACLRLCAGASPDRSGSDSVCNGAAMRAALLGVLLCEEPARRAQCSRALALVTHRDPRAVEGAAFVTELAAQSALGPPSREIDLGAASSVVRHPALLRAIRRAAELAACAQAPQAARELGTSGFVVHTVAFAAYCAARYGADRHRRRGERRGRYRQHRGHRRRADGRPARRRRAAAPPAPLIDALEDGPLGRGHLAALADALSGSGHTPRFRPALLLLRNLSLFPVVLAHGFRRLFRSELAKNAAPREAEAAAQNGGVAHGRVEGHRLEAPVAAGGGEERPGALESCPRTSRSTT
jgi:ADP-ribosyl-[dinitrogen reductase] hydrolase